MCDELHPKNTHVMTFTTCALFLLLPVLASARPSANALEARARQVTASSKAGMAWPNGNYNSIGQYESNKVSWYYTWSPQGIDDNTLEFVPMLWGSTQVNEFASSINNTITSKGVTAILGMNEPNLQGQSDISPQDAAGIWQQYIQPLKAAYGVRLGSPAPTSAPDGKTWLQSFLTACTGCTVDFIALHYYDVNATNMIQYITDMHNTFNLNLWITEWACQNYNNGPQCSSDGVVDFMKQTQSFMDQTDWVERYAYFGAMTNLQGVNTDNALMDKNGKITQLGEQYIGNSSSSSSGGGGGLPSVSPARKISASWVLTTVVVLVGLL